MSVDHGVTKQPQVQPPSLKAVAGDIVIVWDQPELKDSNLDDWWMGEIICVESSARNPKTPSLFQIADVESGVIRWVNADCIQRVRMPLNQVRSKAVPIS